MHNLDPTPGPAGPDKRRRPGPGKRRPIYKADTWHVDDGTASDGSGRPLHHNPVRRVFTAEYKLAILAEYDLCTESGDEGAILRREGLYSSLLTDWRRQHRQGLLKAAVNRVDGGRGGPSLAEVAKLRAENERLRKKLAQAEVIIDVQGKVRGARRRVSIILDAGVDELVAAGVARNRACVALGRSRASHYRHRRPPLLGPPAPRPRSPRAIDGDEANAIVEVLNSERICDQAPAQIWAILLDEGRYVASISTMYRLLRARAQIRERRAQARLPATVKPELVATAPNQVWSWDITKLAGPYKWTWFHLYVILDVLHADRGSSMTSKTVTQLLADLGVLQSHSRPHQSNDNPYSEAQFKTLKYFPTFPK